MENSNKFSTNFETDSRSPLKELSVKNNKPTEMNENLNKTINIDMESLQNPVIVPTKVDVRDSSSTDENCDNQENQEPVSFLTNLNPVLKTETSEANLSDSLYDDAISVAEIECVANITTDDSFINAFANKLNLSPKLDESTKTQINNYNIDSEEQSCNVQSKFVINNSTLDEVAVHTNNNSESQNDVILCTVNAELPEFQESCDYNLNESTVTVTAVSENSFENLDNSSASKLNNPPPEEQEISEKNICEIPISNNESIDSKTNVIFNETYIDTKNEYPEIKDNTFEVIKDNVICQKVVVKEEKLPVSDSSDSNNAENTNCQITDNIKNENETIEIINPSQSLEKLSNSFVNQDKVQENISEQNSVLLESFNNTENSKTLIDFSENVICANNLIPEEIHMSTSESNSEVKEQISNRVSLENSATSTNEMGEIIECFEKQLENSNGAVDNKESLEAKAQVYKEMAEKYATMEAESEKYKIQVCDLKKELKICRQKTVALEADVADLKRRENELNILLEEKNKSSGDTVTDTDNINEQGEQIQRLQASEEALKNEVKDLKGLVKQHENTLKELQRKEVKLTDDLSCKTQSEMQISRVMEEYEKSISNLISENEKMKKERDTAQMHLANIEMAFSDVHQKYERCKAIVQGYKDNEESFKQDIAMNRETIVIQEQKYETLKAHAMAQLEKSNQELAAMKKQHEAEIARLTAQLKRFEIKNMALTESLEQKAKECERLAAICDEYIGRV